MSDIQKWSVSEPYVDIQGTLLEGPFYDGTNHEFRFVDIWQQKLHILDLAQGPNSLKTLDTPDSVGVTANIADTGETYKDRIIVGAKQGYAVLDRQSGELAYLHKVWDSAEKAARMRFNDGAVDRHGRFWAGAMNDPKVQPPGAEGVLFRLDPDLRLHRVLEHLTIPNGIGWNDASDTMYLTDSPTGRIYAFDFDATSGDISNQRVHFELEGPGIPDGFAIDETGCVWSALYGGGKVVRVSPGGEVVGEIALPTRNVTCAAFVGTKLFITTAADEVDDERLPHSVRYGGRLFKVDVGVRGQPKHQFRFQS